jgi:hypothetical protein
MEWSQAPVIKLIKAIGHNISFETEDDFYLFQAEYYKARKEKKKLFQFGGCDVTIDDAFMTIKWQQDHVGKTYFIEDVRDWYKKQNP